MKKNQILLLLLSLLFIGCTVFVPGGFVYLLTPLMFLLIVGFIRQKNTWAIKMTRWSKANPFKAQILITVMQVFLLAFGLMAGYNYQKLGVRFSDTIAIIFCVIMVAGFLSVSFLPKRGPIAIPALVNKQRLVFIGIALSSFMLAVIKGNRMEKDHPNSFITHSLQTIDQAVFPENQEATASLDEFQDFSQHLSYVSFSSSVEGNIEPAPNSTKPGVENLKAEKKLKKLEKRKEKLRKRLERHAMAAGLSAGAILLIILLAVTLCAGICMIIGGFGGSAALIPLGVVVAGGSIWGIIKIVNSNREKPKE